MRNKLCLRQWTAVFGFLFSLVTVSVTAQPGSPMTIDLPAQRLSTALATVGDQFGVVIVAPGRLTTGKTAPAIAGTMTSMEAVSRILAGSQLEAELSDAGVIVVVQSGQNTVAQIAQTQSSAPTQSTSTTTQTTQGSQLEEIIVTGDAFSRTDGLLARNSSTGSRFPVDVDLMPNVIRILPQELIESTRATLPQDITRYVSGVQQNPGFGDNAGFILRGFFLNYEILRNGVRGENPNDLSNIERIEVLKGPISSLYGGTGAFAGNINVITKRPLEEFQAEILSYAGSEGFYRLEGDVGGPLTADGSVRYRLTGAAETADSFLEFTDSEKYVGSGSVEWDINETSNFRLDASYLRRFYDFYEGLPLLDGSNEAGITTFDIPIERTLFDPDVENDRENYWNIGAEGNFGLADGLTLRVAGLYTDYDIDIGPTRSFASPAEGGAGRIFDRVTSEGPQNIERWTVQTDLIYRTDAIGQETVFLLGYEHFDQRYDFAANTRNLGQLDIISGVRQPAPPVSLAPFFSGFLSYEGDAVYAQAFSQVNDQLAVLVGLRYDDQGNDNVFDGAGEPISSSELSPRVGATYAFTDNTTLFANWGESFSPNFAFDIDGDVFESDKVRQLEVGVRQKLFDDRALLTVAAFDIKRFNVVIPDISEFGQSIASGEQTSSGFEIDLTGEILPGLDAIFTYAFNDTEVTEENDPNFGQQLAGAPENNASVFVQYEVQDGRAVGWGFNAGLVWNDEIQASLPNSIVTPSVARLDLGVSYTLNDWRLAVNVNNVTDRDNYVTNLFALFPQTPRQYLVTLSKRF